MRMKCVPVRFDAETAALLKEGATLGKCSVAELVRRITDRSKPALRDNIEAVKLRRAEPQPE